MKTKSLRVSCVALIALAIVGCQSGPRWAQMPQKLAWWKKDAPAADSSLVARAADGVTPAEPAPPTLPSTLATPQSLTAAATPPSANSIPTHVCDRHPRWRAAALDDSRDVGRYDRSRANRHVSVDDFHANSILAIDDSADGGCIAGDCISGDDADFTHGHHAGHGARHGRFANGSVRSEGLSDRGRTRCTSRYGRCRSSDHCRSRATVTRRLRARRPTIAMP